MVINRKRLLGFAATLFVIYEIVAFYKIHVLMLDQDCKLRYGCIIAATVFAWVTLLIELITARSEGEWIWNVLFNASDGNLLRIAMIFTLIADYYMIAIENVDNLKGVTVFLGTQLFIFLHIMVNDGSKQSRRWNLILRICLMIAIAFLANTIFGEKSDKLSVISAIYFTNLCVNAIFAHKIGRGGILMTIGLILFALCDINVGLLGLSSIYADGVDEGTLLYTLTNTGVDLMWLFYIPSQTIIPLTILIKPKSR